MRRCISEPTTRFPRPAPRSVATSASTTPSALIRALTGKRRTMLTSVACSRSRQPEPGRGATYLNRNAVQTNRATAVIHGKKSIVVLAEADLRSVQLLFDEAVAVEVIGGLERQERGDAHHHRAEGFVTDVEIVVGEAAALAGKDAIIGILGWEFRHGDAKGRPLLHALENE